MFARILECEVKLEKKDGIVKILKYKVLPTLKKQTGFLEILSFFSGKYERRESDYDQPVDHEGRRGAL
ncbi:MAG: hypothetical protein WB762_12390 [Candidatus Sulfotelmatobacter sp.]